MSLIDRIRRGEPLPLPTRALLSAATPITRSAMALRLASTTTKVDARVISFGNLTAGGTGKTPAVIERARVELAEGKRVAVLTRGYGSERTHQPLLANHHIPASRAVAMLGDEPALMRALLPEVAVVKSRDRVAGARAAIEAGYDTLILDDGFQAVHLERDENILLVDALNPFGNGRLLPRGILREPLAAAGRATHVYLTHCDLVPPESLTPLKAQIHFLAPGVSIRETHHAPARVQRLSSNEARPVESLKQERVVAVCGIGHPESFVQSLQALGAEVVEQRFFRDHASIPPEAFKSNHLVVTTEKDAIRAGDAAAGAWSLGIELREWKSELIANF